MQECPNRQMALSFNQQTHYCFLCYYSRCPQSVILSARIFDCSLPEREFEIREISHNSAFAIPLFINPVTSKEMEMTETHVKVLTFSVAKQHHRITEFSEFERDFKCASVLKAGWKMGGYSGKKRKRHKWSSTSQWRGRIYTWKRQDLFFFFIITFGIGFLLFMVKIPANDCTVMITSIYSKQGN